MFERERVTFPNHRIEFRTAATELERIMERQGGRFLAINITPERLIGKPPFDTEPLVMSVTEILPRKKGQLLTAPTDREAVKMYSYEKPQGFFLNAGTHNEATSLAMALNFRDTVLSMVDRPYVAVIATGLYESTERLKEYCLASGIMPKADFVDINRKFIDPFASPADVFEEAAQKYLRFIISRYYLQNLAYIDLHTDPFENDLRQHLILDRTSINSYKDKNLLKWATNSFPAISVVYDLPKAQYEEEKLNFSLPASLISFGVKYAVTYECSAGMALNLKNSILTKKNLLYALMKMEVLDEETACGLLANLEDEVKNTQLQTANSLLDKNRLRRELIKIPVTHNGVLEVIYEVMHRVLHQGDIIAILQGSVFPFKQTLVRMPKNMKDCVILGLPNLGIIDTKKDNEIIFSVATEDI